MPEPTANPLAFQTDWTYAPAPESADHFKLRAHAVPLRMPQFPVYLIWHQRLDADAGHQWFRTHLTEFCQRL